MVRLILFVGGLGLLAACGSNNSASGSRCVPGAVVSCPCSGGGQGTQVCSASGSSFGACECGDAGGLSDVVGGDTQTTGTDGTDGSSGVDGTAATDGLTGADGTSGNDGTDGISGDVWSGDPDVSDAVTVDGMYIDGASADADSEVTGEVDGSDGGGEPTLSFDSNPVVFGDVPVGGTSVKTVTLVKQGGSLATVHSMSVSGSGDFVVSFGDFSTTTGAGPLEFDPPVDIVTELVLTIAFTAEEDTAGDAVLTVNYGNGGGDEVSVKLLAGPEYAALVATPSEVDFGAVHLGAEREKAITLSSTGSLPVWLTSVDITAATSSGFSVDLPGALPLLIPPEDSIVITARWKPTGLSQIVGGAPVPDTGQLVFTYGDEVDDPNPTGAATVGLTAAAVSDACPTADIVVAEGLVVEAPATLHLSGAGSEAPGGAVTGYEWTVSDPATVYPAFEPSANQLEPVLELTAVGQYEIRLEVTNNSGTVSCLPAIVQVEVVPSPGIYVELLWHTPNDLSPADEGPEAGSDLDLHFAHKHFAASGPDVDNDGSPDVWFNNPFDVFWFNVSPNWGSFDPSFGDDPYLVRDDTDGVGPEALSYPMPIDTPYQVGVHYWSDHEYGPSQATLKIYIDAELAWSRTATLETHDMWDAATIDWPAGTVTPVDVDGSDKITPEYQNPFFFQPLP